MKRVRTGGIAIALLAVLVQPSGAEPALPDTVFTILSQAFANEDAELFWSVLAPKFSVDFILDPAKPNDRISKTRSECVSQLSLVWLSRRGKHFSFDVIERTPIVQNGQTWQCGYLIVTITNRAKQYQYVLTGSAGIQRNRKAKGPPFILTEWTVTQLTEGPLRPTGCEESSVRR